MDRPDVSREELVAILEQDRDPHANFIAELRPTDQGLAAVGDGAGRQHRFNRCLATLAAGRLLSVEDPNAPFLTPEIIRQPLVAVALRAGSFQALGPASVRNVAVAPTVDFLIESEYLLDLSETCAQRWERVRIIMNLALAKFMTATEFLQLVEDAQDDILRATSSLDAFREQAYSRINLRHPDRLARHVRRYRQAVTDQARARGFVGKLRVALVVDVPDGDAYWTWRAQQVQGIEQIIDRIWPGWAIGSRIEPAYDA